MLRSADDMGEEPECHTREAASRLPVSPLCAETGDRPRDRVAKRPLIEQLERDSRNGVRFKALAIGSALLGLLTAGPVEAQASTTTTAASTVVPTGGVQADSHSRDTSAKGQTGQRNDWRGIRGAVVASPSIEVDSIEDSAVRTIATHVLSTVARELQHRFVRPPAGLRLEAKSCGENTQHPAYWERGRKAIGLCLELIRDRLQAETSFRKRQAEGSFYGPYGERANDRFATYDAEQSLLFIAYHELGHALVDINDLKVEGNEEITVDGFATWWAIQGGVADAAVHGAMAFDQFGILEDRSPYDFAKDIHGRSADRYRNIACWLVGAGHRVPEHFLRDLRGSPESVCRTAYQSLAQQWTDALHVEHP